MCGVKNYPKSSLSTCNQNKEFSNLSSITICSKWSKINIQNYLYQPATIKKNFSVIFSNRKEIHQKSKSKK